MNHRSQPEKTPKMPDQAQLEALLRSKDAQRLIAMLRTQNGDALTTAAKQAQNGSTAALAKMLETLAGSPEGEALLHRLERQAEK